MDLIVFSISTTFLFPWLKILSQNVSKLKKFRSLQVLKSIVKGEGVTKLTRTINGLRNTRPKMEGLFQKIDGNIKCYHGSMPSRYHKPVPLQKLLVNGVNNVVIKHTDPQLGGVKIGQVAKHIDEIGHGSSLAKMIDEICAGKSSVGILFDNFDGDVIANWGQPGAAHAWEAYLEGFSNLYCARACVGTARYGRIFGERVVFAGMIDANDLQKEAMELESSKREVKANARLSALVNQHSLRVMDILKDTLRSQLTSLFLLGGGDNAIYSCAAAVKSGDNRILLLRIDRHMDERNTSLRSHPSNDGRVYQHSGNGVTQAKAEKMIDFDFLIACDYDRNNDECINNSEKQKETCFTSITSIEKMRFDPKVYIDAIMQDVAKLLESDDKLELVVNIDCDTFNGIPSSAETFTGGLDPIWAFYFLEKLSVLPKPPRVIRIAELHFCGDDARRKVAIDFAAEILKSGVKAMQLFYKDI